MIVKDAITISHALINGAYKTIDKNPAGEWLISIHTHYKKPQISVFCEKGSATFIVGSGGITLIEATGNVAGTTVIAEDALKTTI